MNANNDIASHPKPVGLSNGTLPSSAASASSAPAFAASAAVSSLASSGFASSSSATAATATTTTTSSSAYAYSTSMNAVTFSYSDDDDDDGLMPWEKDNWRPLLKSGAQKTPNMVRESLHYDTYLVDIYFNQIKLLL